MKCQVKLYNRRYLFCILSIILRNNNPSEGNEKGFPPGDVVILSKVISDGQV